MLLFIPRSLCALKRVAAKTEHARFGATQGIRIALAKGLFRAEATDGHRAVVVQGLVPTEEPPWPGFKDLPNDAFETIVLPKDLERACKLGDGFLQSRFGLLGIATIGGGVCLGLGTDVLTAPTVEGRFPNMDNVIPKKRPLFTFRVDPKVLAETLLAMAELLPEEAKGVQCFYYGDGLPLGFCAKNIENGLMIDALAVPLTPPKPDAKEKSPESKAAEGKNDDKRRKEPGPEANGQASKIAVEAPAPTVQEAKGEEPAGRKKAKA
jgi:hypothetical protein